MTHAPTSSTVLARLIKKSPELIRCLASKRSGFEHVFEAFSSNRPQDTALTFTTPNSSAFGGRSSHLKFCPASILSISCRSGTFGEAFHLSMDDVTDFRRRGMLALA